MYYTREIIILSRESIWKVLEFVLRQIQNPAIHSMKEMELTVLTYVDYYDGPCLSIIAAV